MYLRDPFLLGTLTIGQAPRADITPLLDAALPPGTRSIHAGVLDGLSPAEIARCHAVQTGQPVLVSRLLDGSTVTLNKATVRDTLVHKLTSLEAQGCSVILLLCTGQFHGLSLNNSWLLEPDRMVPPAIAALAGERQVGIVVPLPEQVASESAKFSTLHKPPIYTAASPYTDGLCALRDAARMLRERGAQMLLLDCMGFTETHRCAAREASGLPVVLSSALIAKLTAELFI